MRRLVAVGWAGALIVAGATYPAVAFMASGAIDAYMIAAKSPEMVKDNKEDFTPRDPKETDKAYRSRVMEIYGNPIDYTTPVVFVPREKFIRPSEDPELVLLPVDKQKGENPLQVKSLYFFAKYIVMSSGTAFVLLLALHLFLARRARKGRPGAAA